MTWFGRFRWQPSGNTDGQHSLTGCLYEDAFCVSGNYIYVWNAGKLAVRRAQIRSDDKAVKTPAHEHSCDRFKQTDKLTLQVVVDQDTEEINHIQASSPGNSLHAKLSITYTLTPPSNRLNFLPCNSGRKTRPPSLRIRLMFCWESLLAVPPAPCIHRRLAATNCLNSLTVYTSTLSK